MDETGSKAFEHEFGRIKEELEDVRQTVLGPKNTPYYGLLHRVEKSESDIAKLQEIQDEFVREKKAADAERDRKETFRNKVVIVALTTLFGAVATVVIQLFVLLTGGGV